MITLKISLIILILSIGIFGFDNTFAQNAENDLTNNESNLDFEINQLTIDKKSYRYGETIVISGNINSKELSYPGQIQLDISIADSVYPFEIFVDRNGDFTFEITAGKPGLWWKKGMYSLGLIHDASSYGAYINFEYIPPGPPRGTYITTDKNSYIYSPSSYISISGNIGDMQLPITLVVQCDAVPDQIKKLNIDNSFGQFHTVDNYGNFEYVIGTLGFDCKKQTTTGTITIQGTNTSTSFQMSVRADTNNESEIIASTDKTSYQKGDSIIFSGKVINYEFGKKVYYEMTSPDGFTLFMNEIDPNSDGSFSHTFEAEWASWAWEGDYTIKYYYDNFMNNEYETTYNYSRDDTAEPLPEPFQKTESTVDSPPKVKEKIPEWIKTNAFWWAEGQIDDSDFSVGIEHLIKEDIISIPDLPESGDTTGEEIPDWIKNNAAWWADGLISNEDFVSGLKYMVEHGIIKV